MSADTFYGSDFGALEAFDPEIAGVLVSELDRIRGGPAAHRQREHDQPRGAHRPRLDAVQQVRRGLPRPPLLRRLLRGRQGRDARPSSGARRSSAPTTPTSSRTPVPAPTRRSTARSCSRARRILAMALPMGGHLTHGTKVSFSGKWFNAVHYGVDKQTEDIDYAEVERLAKEHQPKMILAGGSAIPRLIDFEFFRRVADEVGAIFWVDAAHFIGLVAGKAIPSPVPYADVVTFTTHKVLRGPRSGALVCKEEHAAKLDKAVFPMMQGGPQMHTIAAKAVNFKECATPEYQHYARAVIENAAVLADRAGRERHPPDHRRHRHPPVAARPAGRRRRPAPTPRRAPTRPGIVLNKNAIPFDPQKPNIASGIRVGTPCVTTQGMGTDEMRQIAELIATAVTKGDADPDHAVSQEVRAGVTDLVTRFPAYPRG